MTTQAKQQQQKKQQQQQQQQAQQSNAAPQWAHGYVPLNASAQAVKNHQETAAQAKANANNSNKKKKVAKAMVGSTKSNPNIKVSQATVNQLLHGTMEKNIAFANSGKASAEYVEAAKRFYPGRVTGGPYALKQTATKKKAKSTKKKSTKKTGN